MSFFSRNLSFQDLTPSGGLFLCIIRYRLLVCAVLIAITAFFGWFAARVQFDNTIESYFLKKDLGQYDSFLDQFGSDEIVVVAFGDGEIFTKDNLVLIDSLTKKIRALPHVRRVLSLTSVKVVYGDENEVYFERLVPALPPVAGDLRVIKERALADPIIPGTLVSRDTRFTAIVAEIDHIIGEFDYKVDLLRRVRELLEREETKEGKHFSIGGTSVLDDALFRYTERDQRLFFPAVIAVIAVLTLVMFRRLRWAVTPIVVVLLSVIWTYGFLVLMGYKINVISTIVGPLLLAVAIADSMHFVAEYVHGGVLTEQNKLDRLGATFGRMLRPCFMTSLTTVLGLLSLMIADLVPIRQFGLVAAVGVGFAFLITVSALPVLLFFLPVPGSRGGKGSHPLEPLLVWLGEWRRTRAGGVIAAALLLTVPAFLLLRSLSVGTNTLDYFRSGDPVRVQTEWIDGHLGGTTSLEFFLDTGEKDGVKEPEVLRRIEAFQEYLRRIDGITGVYSMVDLVKALNRAFHGGAPEHLTIPSSARQVAQQLLVIEGSKDFTAFISRDYSRARITARVEIGKSQRLAHQMPEIEDRLQALFEDIPVAPTGIVYLMSRMENYLLSSQIKSFLLAFVLVSLAIMVMLRSVRMGVLAMIPNILPVLFTLALMPLLGISLDIGTVMIAGVALGLVVDDTIHFLSRVRLELQEFHDMRRAIAASMRETGTPIIFTSVVLSLAFSVLVFASFNPIIHFGILASAVIILALLFDLLVLPAVLGFVSPGRRD